MNEKDLYLKFENLFAWRFGPFGFVLLLLLLLCKLMSLEHIGRSSTSNLRYLSVLINESHRQRLVRHT